MEGERARSSPTLNFLGSSKGNVPMYVLDSDKREYAPSHPAHTCAGGSGLQKHARQDEVIWTRAQSWLQAEDRAKGRVNESVAVIVSARVRACIRVFSIGACLLPPSLTVCVLSVCARTCVLFVAVCERMINRSSCPGRWANCRVALSVWATCHAAIGGPGLVF